jgi:hypothetical protein
VAGRGEDRAVVCLEHVQPVGEVRGVVLTRLKRQIKIGTEERGAEFRLCGIPHKPNWTKPQAGCSPLWGLNRGRRQNSRM